MIVLLFRLVVVLVDLFTVAFAIAATASFVWELGRFLKAAPSAIRQDLADRRAREASWQPPLHHVRNEVEPPAPLPPKIPDPRALMPRPEEDPGGGEA